MPRLGIEPTTSLLIVHQLSKPSGILGCFESVLICEGGVSCTFRLYYVSHWRDPFSLSSSSEIVTLSVCKHDWQTSIVPV